MAVSIVSRQDWVLPSRRISIRAPRQSSLIYPALFNLTISRRWQLFHPKPSINIMFSPRWVGNMRSSTAVRLSIRLGGRTTTVTLENAFWLGLKEIARRRRIKVSDLVREIGAKRQHSNFSSELRLFVLEFYRKQACFPNQRATAGGVLSDLEPTRFERCEVIARPPRRQDRQRS